MQRDGGGSGHPRLSTHGPQAGAPPVATAAGAKMETRTTCRDLSLGRLAGGCGVSLRSRASHKGRRPEAQLPGLLHFFLPSSIIYRFESVSGTTWGCTKERGCLFKLRSMYRLALNWTRVIIRFMNSI